MELDPEVARERLAQLDRYHQQKGDYDKWVLSEDRTHFAPPGQVVRVVNWTNLRELCRKSGLDERMVVSAYHEAVQTGDILFVFYEEIEDGSTNRG